MYEVVEEEIGSGVVSKVLKMENSAVEGLTMSGLREACIASTPALGSLATQDTDSIERTASERGTRADDRWSKG